MWSLGTKDYMTASSCRLVLLSTVLLIPAISFAGCSNIHNPNSNHQNSRPNTAHFIPSTSTAQKAKGASSAPGLIKARQPDGSFFYLTLRGNAWRNWHETSDGYSIVYNKEDKWWYYAKCRNDRLVPGKIRTDQALPQGWPRHLRPGKENCRDSTQ